MNNPIIDEVRAARAALAEEHGYDREQILEWARQKQAELLSHDPKQARTATAGKPNCETSETGQHVAATSP